MWPKKVEDIVFELAKPIIDRNSFELVEIEFKRKDRTGS